MKQTQLLILLGAGLLLGACQAPHPFPRPDANWKSRTGQLMYTHGNRVVIGEVAVSTRGGEDFQLEFQKAGGVPLIKIQADATTFRADGLLAGGSWQGPPHRVPKALRGWASLRHSFGQLAGSPGPATTTFSAHSGASESIFKFVFTP